MSQIFSMCLDAAISAIVLVPLFLILNKRTFHSKRRTLGYIIFAVYLCGMFAVVGLPDICYIRFAPRFNFRPFAYMFSDGITSALNVLLFLPLGIFLTLFWETYRAFPRTVLFGFCCSLLIELLQIFTYRATDINDLITNTSGAFLGWCLGRIFLHFAPGFVPAGHPRDLTTVCSCSFATMFFIHPFLSDFLWRIL